MIIFQPITFEEARRGETSEYKVVEYIPNKRFGIQYKADYDKTLRGYLIAVSSDKKYFIYHQNGNIRYSKDYTNWYSLDDNEDRKWIDKNI